MNGLWYYRHWPLSVVLAGWLLLPVHAVAQANSEAATRILAALAEPPRSCTQVPFWFWNGPLAPEEFRQQLREMADKGVYAAMPHPRFGMDRREYLEEPFWRAMTDTLDEAKKLGMQIWLYDDYNWPSGGAGGRVTDGHPELYPRGLDYVKRVIQGPQHLVLGIPTNTEPRMEEFEKYVRAFLRPVACSNQTWSAWGELKPKSGQIEGDIPSGAWEVLAFYQSLGHNPSPLDEGSNSMSDYLSDRPLRRFLSLTHEQYSRRFGSYFGTVIPAVFSDESSTTAPAPFPWTEDFAQEFARRRGADLLTKLPQLLEAAGGDSMETRMAYWQTVTELYGGRHLQNYGDWCRQHGLKFTGHVYEENIASYAHAPQLMQLLRSMDLPGFDALGPKCPAYNAKTAISVAHLENREEAMCESMGLAGGWNCTLDMLRTGYNTLGWLGVSRFIPHAFFQTVENPRVECPFSFFYQNPYWKYYRAIADLTARLSYFNRLGRHVAPCAVYYPIESLWADSVGGKGQSVLPWQHRSEGNAHAAQTIKAFNELVEGLTTARWDLDVVDNALLARAEVVKTSGRTELAVGPERFRVVVVPPVTAIGSSALKMLDQFLQQGGKVVWLDRWPEQVWPSTPGEPAATLKRWSEAGASEPSSPAGARPVLVRAQAGEVVRWLEKQVQPDVLIRGDLKALRISHRRADSVDTYLLFNDSKDLAQGAVRLNTTPACALVDLDTGKAWAGEFSGNWLRLSLRPGQSAVALFAPELPKLPPWRLGWPAGQIEDLSQDWEIQAADKALDHEWRSTCGETETETELAVFRAQKRDFQKWTGWQETNYDDRQWPITHALRGNALFADASPILFRAVLPPGTKSLSRPLPVTGEYALWINGKLVEKKLGPPEQGNRELSLGGLVKGVNDVLALEVASHFTAAGLNAPLSVRCGPTRLDHLRSWKALGLEHYTGRVWYRKRLTLETKPARLWLDLGQVEHYAEVYLNGKLVTTLLWPPYEADLSAYCQRGDNELVLVVANSIANRFAWDVWGTRGSGRAEPSGVLGPVRLWRQ